MNKNSMYKKPVNQYKVERIRDNPHTKECLVYVTLNAWTENEAITSRAGYYLNGCVYVRLNKDYFRYSPKSVYNGLLHPHPNDRMIFAWI